MTYKKIQKIIPAAGRIREIKSQYMKKKGEFFSLLGSLSLIAEKVPSFREPVDSLLIGTVLPGLVS